MRAARLNAPTGAWCSLTPDHDDIDAKADRSQCTYRCVVLPDDGSLCHLQRDGEVSMHLQVRGAP